MKLSAINDSLLIFPDCTFIEASVKYDVIKLCSFQLLHTIKEAIYEDIKNLSITFSIPNTYNRVPILYIQISPIPLVMNSHIEWKTKKIGNTFLIEIPYYGPITLNLKYNKYVPYSIYAVAKLSGILSNEIYIY